MKNTLINKNTTILIVIFLLLIFVYSNIEDKHVMVGGAECTPEMKAIALKVIAKNKLYNFIFGSKVKVGVFIAINIILLILAIYFYNKYVIINGIQYPPAIMGDNAYAGSYTGLTVQDLGGIFLNRFYNIAHDKYLFKNSPGQQLPDKRPDEEAAYDQLISDFKTNTELNSHLTQFCDIVQPCDPCKCEGATGPKGEPSCQPGETAKKIKSLSTGGSSEGFTGKEHLDDTSSSRVSTADKFYGVIPLCSCDPTYPTCEQNEASLTVSTTDESGNPKQVTVPVTAAPSDASTAPSSADCEKVAAVSHLFTTSIKDYTCPDGSGNPYISRDGTSNDCLRSIAQKTIDHLKANCINGMDSTTTPPTPCTAYDPSISTFYKPSLYTGVNAQASGGSTTSTKNNAPKSTFFGGIYNAFFGKI